jgi:hypothetical protein
MVLVSDPFYWPSDHGAGPDPADEVRVMEEVMAIMQKALEPPAPAALEAIPALLQPAKQVFRDILLGVDVPELR